MIILQYVILIIAMLLLWKGADLLVESASVIAKSFGVSDLVIGLTVVSLGTSAPEFAVSIDAALKAKASISLGNIVGSNIFNIGFILGIVAIIKTIKTTKTIVYRDGVVLIAVSILLYIFISDNLLGRGEGIAFMILLVVYLFFLFVTGKEKNGENVNKVNARPLHYFLLLLGIAMIIAGGEFLVSSASSLARWFGISEWVISVTIVAAGTSAPELVTSLVAVLKGRSGISIGNLIGSDIFNLLGVLGLAAVIHPLSISPAAVSSVFMLIGMVGIAFILMRLGWAVSRIDGIILFSLALFRWFMDFYCK